MQVMRGCLGDLAQLLSGLAKQNPETEGMLVTDWEASWSCLDASYTAMQPFRESSLDRWYRKTLLASGTAALSNNLRVFNQSISAQVSITLLYLKIRILTMLSLLT